MTLHGDYPFVYLVTEHLFILDAFWQAFEVFLCVLHVFVSMVSFHRI